MSYKQNSLKTMQQKTLPEIHTHQRQKNMLYTFELLPQSYTLSKSQQMTIQIALVKSNKLSLGTYLHQDHENKLYL